eukprot:TRINITY_DN2365_c1_g2_i1.p1 TRINITY_DN2365_c1_g2~~TRINITY_DN2365_c1_g2_i1.p1  ORF type:complete len:537 (+),score=220.46 TRINITY_DN2365_c1_g2_i1:104-1714(+)
MSEVDVLVVGAGVSGLRCAMLLHEAGLSVAVQDARERIGGRTLSEPLQGITAAGERCDKGAGWIGPKQRLVCDLVRKFGLDTVEQYVTGVNRIETSDGRVVEYTGDIPWKMPGGLPALLEMGKLMAQVDWMSAAVDLDNPTGTKQGREWDSISLQQWLDATVRHDAVRDVAATAAQCVMVNAPKDLSLLFFLMNMRSGHSFQDTTDAKGGAQDSRLVGGMLTLSEKMAERLPESALRLGAGVRRVERAAEGGFAVTASDGSVQRAKQVILALSPEARARIDFGVPVSRALAKAEPCVAVKASVGYRTPFWRKKGFTGSVVAHSALVSMIMDNSTKSGGAYLAVFFIAAAYHRTPAKDREAVAVQEICRHFGDEGKDYVLYTEQDWPNDHQCTVSCVYNGAPGQLTEAGRDVYASSVEGLHWAGTESAVQWKGYVDGALESSVHACLAVLDQQPRAVAAGSELAALRGKYRSAQAWRKARVPRAPGVVYAVLSASLVAAAAFAWVAYRKRACGARAAAAALASAALLRVCAAAVKRL